MTTKPQLIDKISGNTLRATLIHALIVSLNIALHSLQAIQMTLQMYSNVYKCCEVTNSYLKGNSEQALGWY